MRAAIPSRRDEPKIARCFNAGSQAQIHQSPAGTTDFFGVFSAVPPGLGQSRRLPGVETPGYSQMSRRDIPAETCNFTNSRSVNYGVYEYKTSQNSRKNCGFSHRSGLGRESSRRDTSHHANVERLHRRSEPIPNCGVQRLDGSRDAAERLFWPPAITITKVIA